MHHIIIIGMKVGTIYNCLLIALILSREHPADTKDCKQNHF